MFNFFQLYFFLVPIKKRHTKKQSLKVGLKLKKPPQIMRWFLDLSFKSNISHNQDFDHIVLEQPTFLAMEKNTAMSFYLW